MINPWQKVKKNTNSLHFLPDSARFRCDYCEKQFFSKLGYNTHLRQKHGEGGGEPEPVFVKEEPVETEEEEMLEDVETRMYACACGETFWELIDLVRHESKKHSSGFEKMVKGLKDLLLYVINQVEGDEESLPVKKEEEIEVAVDDSYGSFTEEEDKEKVSPIKKGRKINKKVAVKRDSTPKKTKTSKNDKFLCQYCDKQLSHKKSLEYHVAKKHQNVPLFRCKYCNRYFIGESDFQLHIKSHDNDPELVCSACGYMCRGAAILRQHVSQKHRTTELEPRFFCPTCNKGFYYKCKLEDHSIIHKPQSERNAVFRCDICTMAFTRKSALTRHKLSHDDSTKTFTCTFCSKNFRRRQHLTTHLAMHTGARAREEVCPDCGAIYSERRGLNNHMERVHGRPLEGYRKQKVIVEAT